MAWDPKQPGSTSQADNQYAPASAGVDFGSILLTSEGGTKFVLVVADDGALSTEEVQ